MRLDGDKQLYEGNEKILSEHKEQIPVNSIYMRSERQKGGNFVGQKTSGMLPQLRDSLAAEVIPTRVCMGKSGKPWIWKGANPENHGYGRVQM